MSWREVNEELEKIEQIVDSLESPEEKVEKGLDEDESGSCKDQER